MMKLSSNKNDGSKNLFRKFSLKSLTNKKKAPDSTPTPTAAVVSSITSSEYSFDRKREVLDDLDAKFFVKDFDPIANMLENLPDFAGNEEKGSREGEMLDRFLIEEMESMDVAKDAVLAKLAENVQANYSKFIKGMRQVQEVDLDLAGAQIQVKDGRRLLGQAKQDLIINHLKVVKIQRNRQHVLEIIETCSEILEFFEKEKRIYLCLDQQNFPEAVHICVDIQESLKLTKYQSFSILKPLSNRMKKALPDLRIRFDQVLEEVVTNFDSHTYEQLMRAYIALEEHAEIELFSGSKTVDGEKEIVLEQNILCSLPDVIVRSVSKATKTGLKKILMANIPKYTKESSDQSGSTNLDNNSTNKYTLTQNRSEDFDVSLTISKLSHPQVLDYFLRSFEFLTNLLHSYYLIVQWHRDPLSMENHDLEYLHRCGIDSDDDSDEEDVEKEENCKRPVHRSRSSNFSDLEVAEKLDLQNIQITLIQYRKIVWEHIQQILVEILDRVNIGKGTKLEHIARLAQACEGMIEFGEQFGGGNSSHKFSSMIRNKSLQFLKNFNLDTIEVLRMLVDTEEWKRVPITFGNKDDVFDLIEKRSGYSFDWKTREHQNVPMHKNILVNFLRSGNPFAEEFHEKWTQNEALKQFNSNYCGNHVDEMDEQIKRMVAMEDKHKKVEEHQELEADLNNKQDYKKKSAYEEEVAQFGSKWVITASSLSGFVRYTGMYLKIMEQMPCISLEARDGLLEMFDFFFYVVFTIFVPQDYIARLYNGNPPQNLPTSHLFANVERIRKNFQIGLLHQASSNSNGLKQDMQGNSSTNSELLINSNATRKAPARISNFPHELLDYAKYHGLSCRCVAAESLSFLHYMLETIQPIIISFSLPKSSNNAYSADPAAAFKDSNNILEPLRKAYAQNESSMVELQEYTYATVSPDLIDAKSIPKLIQKVKWDRLQLSEEHNGYVLEIVRKCGELWGGIQGLENGSIPVLVREEIWSYVVRAIMEALVEGFASVKKCSTEGRALMSMDLQALQNGIDLINRISTKNVMCKRSYVNNYIKAFYYCEEDLLVWIKENTSNYRKAYLIDLVTNGIGTHMKKKKLKEVKSKIDEFYRSNNSKV